MRKKEKEDGAVVLFHIPRPTRLSAVEHLTVAKFSPGTGKKMGPADEKFKEFVRRLKIEFGDRADIEVTTTLRDPLIKLKHVKPLSDGDVACESGSLAHLIETFLGIKATVRECDEVEIKAPPL